MNQEKNRISSGQKIQDDIIRAMSADERMTFGISLWNLGYELDSKKITYGTDRSAAASDRNHGNA